MPLPNPYTPGEPAHVLGGRAKELARITERLDRVSTLGEYGGSLLVFHSPRGIGKTSLLRQAQRAAVAAHFATVWVSASPGSSLLAELAYSTRTAIASTSFIAEKQKSTWSAEITQLEVQLGVPAANVRTTIEPTKNTPAQLPGPAPTVGEAPISALEGLLHSAAKLVRACDGAGLVVFVDEIHAADVKSLGIVLNALQNLNGSPASTALTAVFAGLPTSPDVITGAATFGERSSFVALGRLNDEDSRVALVKPAQSSGVAWGPDALDQVVLDAGGYPYFVQLLGSTTWDAAAPGAGNTLTLDAVRVGYEAALQQLHAVFRARWNAATNLDKKIITAMVELMLESDSEDVDRATIAARADRDSRAISVARDRLISRGIVEASGHGLLRFTIPGFAAYVAAEAGLRGTARLRELTGFPQLGEA